VSYATAANLIDIYTADAIVTLAPPRTGITETYNTTKVGNALQRASDEIDSYLARRYTVPVSPIPEMLIRMCSEIAYYYIATTGYSTGATDQDRQRYEDAIAWCKSINAGKAVLVDAAEITTTPSNADLAQVTNTTPIFTRANMEYL
jgi:phage gp36-like protein